MKNAIKTQEKISIPSNRWAPLPSDLRLRQYILSITHGAWKKHKNIDPVQWQRKIRSEDNARLDIIHKQLERKKYKKK